MLSLGAVLLSAKLISIPPHPPLHAGELLVAHGNRILRVDPDTGASAVFSPPLLGTNRIDQFGTDAIAIDPDGDIFVVSNDELIRIDPVTGAQSEVHHVACALCVPVPGPIDVGVRPRGVDVAPDVLASLGDRRAIFVGAEDGVYTVRRDHGAVSSTLTWTDDDLDSASPVVAAAVVTDEATALFLSDIGIGEAATSLFGSVLIELYDPGSVLSIDYGDGALVYGLADSICSAGGAGVWFGSDTAGVPISLAGYLRCPVGVAVDPLVPGRIWVADSNALGATPRLIRLDYDGVDWHQSIFTDLPDGDVPHAIAVSPVSFAPEPSAEALGSGALLLLAVRRLRSGR